MDNPNVFREDIPVPDEAALNLMHQQMQMIDPEQKGIDPSRLRTFYPKGSVHHILQPLYILESQGRLSRKRVKNGKGYIETYTWK